MLTYTLLSGLILSGTYLLIALGFILMLRVADIVNMSYGAFVVLGMYCVLVLVDHDVPYLLAISVTPLVGAVVGVLLYATVIRRTRQQGHRQQIVITALLLSLIEVVLQIGFGTDPLLVDIQRTGVRVLGVSIQKEQLVAAVVATFCSAILFVVLRNTNVGKIVEAAGAYEESARSLGIDVERVFGIVFAVGTAMAFLAGGLMSGYTPVEPYLSLDILIVAILISLVGRLSFVGAVLAALGYGLGYAFLVKTTSNPGLSNVVILACLLAAIFAGGLVAATTRAVRRA